MHVRSRCALIAGLAVSVGAAISGALLAAENWPQWRGPQNTGAAPDSSPPLTWSEQQNIKWKVKIPGRGSATPIVWGNKLFVQTAIPAEKKAEATAARDDDAKQPPAAKKSAAKQSAEGREQRDAGQRGGPGGRGRGFGGFGGGVAPTEVHRFMLLCLDRATGKTLWQKVAREEVPHEGHHPSDGTFASSSPVTDGKSVIAYFGSRGLHCFDMDGNLQWSKDLGRMQTRNSFGEGSSPALFGNTIVVTWDHEGEDFIAAFDKANGNELWRQPRDEPTTWSTPLVVVHEGKPQVVTAGSSKIVSYDLRTGKPMWEAGGLTANVIPSPVASGDVVFLTSGFRGSSLKAIRLDATGNVEESDAVLWRLNKSTPYVPSPLLYQDRLYFLASNNAILSCYNAETGKSVVEAKRIEGLGNVYASPVAANGRVYLVDRRGKAVVIKHAVEPAENFEILATNELDDPIDASPAIVGNEMFLRGVEHLYCIGEK
jgi:outer membrane protein assembly factor BamB